MTVLRRPGASSPRMAMQELGRFAAVIESGLFQLARSGSALGTQG
jgi:hypothetical protein